MFVLSVFLFWFILWMCAYLVMVVLLTGTGIARAIVKVWQLHYANAKLFMECSQLIEHSAFYFWKFEVDMNLQYSDQTMWLICFKMWGKSSILKCILLKWTSIRMVDSEQEKSEGKGWGRGVTHMHMLIWMLVFLPFTRT